MEKFASAACVLYVNLWILEGAARKWIPATENILYFARDALLVAALLILALSTFHARRAGHLFWLLLWAVSLLATLQVISATVTLPVALVGLRSYAAPLLLVYLVWRYSPSNALERMSKTILAYVPIQAVIVVLQTLSSPTSWVNKEVGSDAAYFVNFGIVRASGTFSAPAGLSYYVPLAMALALAALLRARRPQQRILAMTSVGLLLMMTAISGSRGIVLAVVIVLIAFVFAQAVSAARGGPGATILLAATGGVAIWVAFALLPEVLDSFLSRFESAARGEDSGKRVFEQTFGFLGFEPTLVGDGIGSHSQAGINMGSDQGWIEIEATKWVAELGVLGLTFAVLRLVGALVLVVAAISRTSRYGVRFTVVAAALVPVIVYGQITQNPSAQGFVSIALSIVLLEILSANRHESHSLPDTSDGLPALNSTRFDGARRRGARA